ncbi:TPA: PHP domain-containing protein [Candidatus Bathyarchaeota archaeon]|nr:PHP domain-containing protein [Candidatus Bathyarchaeota archaeon]
MKLRIDLHVHTNYSGDSKLTIEALASSALENELDGVAITDHDTCEALKQVKKLEEQGLLVIPGIEISSSDGHIIGLGINKLIPSGLPADETIREIKRLGGIAIAAHPLCPFKKSVGEEVLRTAGFNAIEVLNASTLPIIYASEARKLNRLCEELKLPQVGGSDSHTPETVGRAYTLVEVEERTVRAVVKTVRNGKTIPEGSRISLQEAIRRLGMKLKQRFRV